LIQARLIQRAPAIRSSGFDLDRQVLPAKHQEIPGPAEGTFRARGGQGDALPGAAAVSGRGRVDLRFAEDSAGELYLLTKSDGMIRQVVGVR
jgi:hypothetical protein